MTDDQRFAKRLLTNGLQILMSMSAAIGMAWPQPVLAQSQGSRVSVQAETFDFGNVPQKAIVSHVYWLKNTGDQELLIEKMVPNCGCTEAPLETNKAKPGDSIRVEILFGTGYFDGPVTKFTQVVSNSTGRAPALTFHATVIPDSAWTAPLRAEPLAVDLDRDRPTRSADSTWAVQVMLKNSGAETLHLALLDFPDRDVEVEMHEGPLAPGDSHQVVFRFPPDLEDRVFSKSITLAVTGSDTTRVTIPVGKTMRWGPRTLSADNLGSSGS